jgi:mannose-1-phosphate guanylyltransferase / mannose-6-phosphate isomerase
MDKFKVTSEVSAVIMCGGSGSRLWPLSRLGFPKQFLILPEKKEGTQSLFQQAVDRAHDALSDFAQPGPTLIVTSEDHRFIALDQLQDLKNDGTTFLLEPFGRNTAPALTLAALCAEGQGKDVILLVIPSDQAIVSKPEFKNAIKKAIKIAESGAIAILGISPTNPETGYGYIKVDKSRKDLSSGHMPVEHFVEKPNLDFATQYVNDGDYYWNSGIFVLKAKTWLVALRQFQPDILNATSGAWDARTEDIHDETLFLRPDRELFKAIPSESIDCAVIERCPGSDFVMNMVELDAGWSDLGSWDAVWQSSESDSQGNVTSGDTLLNKVSNSLIYSSSRLVSASGIDNLVIIETSDAILVADRKSSQDVKEIVNLLAQQQREEKDFHRKVLRPWGWYDNLEEGPRFKVKRIHVKPGASLSLQKHNHRAEHWIVIKGVADITNGDSQITLKENQSTYIPCGQVHRLSNPGSELLEIIEVQSGDYLGEDDIFRFEDIYGRDLKNDK